MAIKNLPLNEPIMIYIRKIIATSISLTILAIIYYQIDLKLLGQAMNGLDWQWFGLAIAMIAPLTAASAWRICFLTPKDARLSFFQSLNLTLMASVLNAVLPSKLGDIARSYALAEQGHMPMADALSLVIFEKTWDVLALSFWCSIGLSWMLLTSNGISPLFYVMACAIILALFVGGMMVASLRFANGIFSIALNFVPNKKNKKIEMLQSAWCRTLTDFWSNKPKATVIINGSLFLWLMHLFQIWLFVLALNSKIPFLDNAAMASLAIFIGLLPFTLAGIGTRDAAIIFFYQPYIGAPTAAALGLLCTLRYFLPALIGLPFVRRYLVTARCIKEDVKLGT